MKGKRFISAVTAIIIFSGMAFPCYIPFSNNYNEITAKAFSVEESYPNSAMYTASCIIGGLVDLESGNHSASVAKYSDVIERNYAYEQLANNVMEDKSLVITSSMWDTFSRIIDGKLLTAVSGELRQEQIYEIFLMDYLMFSYGSTENSSLLDSVGNFADKTAKYEASILKLMLEKGVADDEEELIYWIENSDSFNDSEIVETMKELNLDNELVGYTEILEDINQVGTSAAEYFEKLSKALALKEVNEERIEFLKSMAEKAPDNTAFQIAVAKIRYMYECSYSTIAFGAGVETMLAYGFNVCWEAISEENPIAKGCETVVNSMDFLFDANDKSSNNIRIIMQYTVGQYAKQVLLSTYPAYATNPIEKTASAFIEAYKNYLAYQDYSSEWARDFVKTATFANNKIVDEWLSDLDSDINYCNSGISVADKYAEIYNKAVYPEINFSDINNSMTFNGHTYQIFDYNMTWTEAEKYCEELGGHLVTISNAEEQQFITQLLNNRTNNQNCYWLGLYKNENNWSWVDDSIFNFTNWAPNEPNAVDNKEAYVHLFGNIWNGGDGIKNIGQWNDASNNGAGYSHDFYDLQNYGFICEWDTTNVKTEISDNDTAIFNGHTYQIFDYNMTWTEAEKYCEELGGHLVTISDESEWNFAVNLFDKSQKKLLWLGAKYNENDWCWVDDTQFSFTLWDTKANEPNRCYRNGEKESYVMTYKIANPSSEISSSDAYKWNDIFESGIFPGEENFFHTNNYCFICEWDTQNIQTENFDINKMILDGHSYKLVPIKKSWNDAEEYAEKLGGHLVTINSSSEQIMIEKMITHYADSHFWLGGYYAIDTDEWKWIDNTNFDFNNWQDGQPDNYCNNEYYIEIYSDSVDYEDYSEKFGRWNDCSSNDENDGNYFIIEWEHLGYTMLGDINQSENTSISDAVLLQRYLLGSYKFSKTQWELADMNQDDNVDIFDMVEMRKMLVNS